MSTKFESIIPTAFSVARSRAFSDIPFSKETATWLEEKVKLFDPKVSGRAIGKAVTLEARYKLINKILLQHNNPQILELACGLLPRGYVFAKEGVTYVETDLADMVALKKNLYKEVYPKLPKNLFLKTANALNMEELTKVTSVFDAKPISVTHEGLLRYLNFEEKEKVAKNVHSLLGKYGGVWVTCDITLIESMLAEDKKNHSLARTKQMTGMDVTKNAFRDLAHAKNFFEELGFNVKVHSLSEIKDELITPKKLMTTKEELEKDLSWVVVEMTLK
jgi:O-methyltransferase involved in polyketide biosynthesis